MTKQLLIYETAVPLSGARHGAHSIEVGRNYGFSAGINAVPLMALEVVAAASEYAVVFTAVGDDVLPAVVLGVKGDQNLYLGPGGEWKAKYVPAFIRRYPFVFSSSDDGKTLTLCVDEAYAGLNTEGRGERLFNEEGKPTAYVEKVLTFLKDYQAHFVRTQVFGKRLKEYDLLEPMQAKVTTPSGATASMTGFMGVNRDRLRALAPERLAQLAKTDELELIYLHLYSMRNFNEVKNRYVEALPPEVTVPAAEALLN